MLHFSHIFVIFAGVMEQLSEKYRRFKEWQVKPYEVAPLTADIHECATCHTQFHGNYCPRCGQKASIGRYSFKSAFLTFLDVWGLGNRGMFRTIRDLLLRPGYMIRDYLNGMQMAYFPPFKMFFLVIALSVLVDSGLNINMQNTLKQKKEHFAKEIDNSIETDDEKKADTKTFEEADINDTIHVNGKPVTINKSKNSDKIIVNKKEFNLKFIGNLKRFINWLMDNQTLVQFLLLLVLSAPMYFFFRHSKRFPDVRYSEFFVSMVYITNMMTIINIIGGFFMPGNASIELLAYVMSIIPLKQLYGYSYKRTILKIIGSFILLMIACIIIACIIGGLAVLYAEYIL
jgi:hypothetical protein